MAYLMKLIRNLYKFFLLARDERRLFFQAIFALPLIHFGLKMLGYSALCALLDKLFPINAGYRLISRDEIIHRGQEMSRIVFIAGKYGFIKENCLRKSLLLWCLLRREGIGGEIHFGVQLKEQALEAHAWVEYQGIVLSDEAGEYEQFHVLLAG